MIRSSSSRHFPSKGFSLAEVVVAVALVGGVLSMIMGAVVMLDRAVANERTIAFTPITGTASAWGYQDIGSAGAPAFPAFSLAPSRLADAQAQSLWRQVHELYEQSVAIGAMNAYMIMDLTTTRTAPAVAAFIGNGGFLSKGFYPLGKSQLTDFYSLNPANPSGSNNANDPRNSMLVAFQNRFPVDSANSGRFWIWNPTNNAAPDYANCGNIDGPTLRVATVFFLGTNDRILGILRMRAWQFDVTDTTHPYRYYEVSLTRLRWTSVLAGNGVDQTWTMLSSGATNIVQDFAYRFAEDRRFPQNLTFPPTVLQSQDLSGDTSGAINTGTVESTRNGFIRFAPAGEDYTLTGGSWDANTNPGASRLQVSLVPRNAVGDNTLYNTVSNTVSPLNAPADEWHLILPDPSLSQSEDRAALRISQGSPFNATLDKSFRRQGKYGCALSVYP